ncbi:type II secretion system protein [Sporosarcina sp. Sa2YVA2]|uniref:Type II secretion system protein n=1 Tax=Sporosarcina quadrami TaxID=2762234 RepID=A0ABR8U564_9BACL|nr:type II secretion system protein [Sporosarcina quadrami]MBD7983166.1 type II secretion system protein [Sporosarcina quadrami]
MINEKGYSWPESILALVVVTVIFGTLLPLYSNMAKGLEKKRVQMHATEIVYQGALLNHYYGRAIGSTLIEEVTFTWTKEGNTICVSYELLGDEVEKCIDY